MHPTSAPAGGVSQGGRDRQAGGDRPTGHSYATRSPVLARSGMAATSHPIAALAGIELLKQGGTAVDAAIAANAVLGVMEPVNCGVGGDLFAIVWDPATRQLFGLNASGRSPREQSREDLIAKLEAAGEAAIPHFGPLSVSVPGAVDGWFELHDRWGSLPMEALLAPSIAYAREGFPVSQVIAAEWRDAWAEYQRCERAIGDLENFGAAFLIDGRPPREGELFANRDLARVYEMIAEGGRDVFYRGDIADVIDAYMRRIGGPLRREDLEAHESEWVTPVSSNYRGFDVFELPPNGQGLAALQMLNILEGFDLAAMGHNTADYLHVHVEAKKLAFEDRARFYADPSFYDVPVEALLSKDYAARRRERIRMDAVLHSDDPPGPGGDTIYLTTADRDGMLVSFIQSNFRYMGSGLVPDGLGFGLQNRGTLFALDGSHPNRYAPGKRPFHTIIPGFVMKDGRPFMSFGVMGGSMQPQGHAQILCNVLDFGMNVQEAGDAARYRHDGSSSPTGERMTDGGTVLLESGVPGAVADALHRRGHRTARGGGAFGGYQAIRVDHDAGVFHGASEMRKDGHAIGY